ncbi:hypothetical protein [Streptomyces diastatochromogenes]|nr:hypothetical protein [Streptomyces diastatochromogenes]MCZ0985293.1 hypothetical protein [Streptomyces diastatochromogenes]
MTRNRRYVAASLGMHWIYGTSRRFDGYNYFSEHPEVAVAWFDDHVR